MPTLELERKVGGLVAGVDEAGCGPWAGPVVAGAAIVDEKNTNPILLEQVNDSKKLTKKKRDHLYALILEDAGVITGVGISSVEEVDTINIRQAALLAMKRAVEALPQTPTHVLADGLMVPKVKCTAQAVVKGDSFSTSIAIASIIAKVERDKIMSVLAESHPEYGWERNAGYGTAAHQEALSLHGVTPHHRKSFAPIAKLLSA